MTVATVVSHVVGQVLGTASDRLPPDTQAAFERRLVAAGGDSLSGLSDAEKSARLTAMGISGLSRLDDQTLIHRAEIMSAAIASADETACATFARATIKGGVVAHGISQTIFSALDASALSQYEEIFVEAVEAEAHGTSPVRRASQSDVSSMYDALIARLPAEDVSTIQGLSSGSAETDVAVCHAERNLYVAGLGLDPQSLATFALVDVSIATGS